MREEVTNRTGHTVIGTVHKGVASNFWMINGVLIHAEDVSTTQP